MERTAIFGNISWSVVPVVAFIQYLLFMRDLHLGDFLISERWTMQKIRMQTWQKRITK